MKSSNRREALVKIIGASGAAIGASHAVPRQWQSPIVESILLPAHAMTSPVESSGGSGPGAPSPFAGTYAVSLDNPGSFTGNCTNATTPIPANTTVQVNTNGSIVVFGLQFNGIVQPDGTIDAFLTNPNPDNMTCTVTNVATGSIVNGNMTGTLTSSQQCEDGCMIQVSTGFNGMVMT